MELVGSPPRLPGCGASCTTVTVTSEARRTVRTAPGSPSDSESDCDAAIVDGECCAVSLSLRRRTGPVVVSGGVVVVVVVVLAGMVVPGPIGVCGMGQATRRIVSMLRLSRNDMMLAVVLSC